MLKLRTEAGTSSSCQFREVSQLPSCTRLSTKSLLDFLRMGNGSLISRMKVVAEKSTSFHSPVPEDVGKCLTELRSPEEAVRWRGAVMGNRSTTARPMGR